MKYSEVLKSELPEIEPEIEKALECLCVSEESTNATSEPVYELTDDELEFINAKIAEQELNEEISAIVYSDMMDERELMNNMMENPDFFESEEVGFNFPTDLKSAIDSKIESVIMNDDMRYDLLKLRLLNLMESGVFPDEIKRLSDEEKVVKIFLSEDTPEEEKIYQQLLQWAFAFKTKYELIGYIKDALGDVIQYDN